ncbi:hypothetical protein B0H11DRAFT_2260886 [Mycena galericulata]|nr:hypothetical protein B0H11DRAFT_2260886 [Mycena galericulata]
MPAPLLDETAAPTGYHALHKSSDEAFILDVSIPPYLITDVLLEPYPATPAYKIQPLELLKCTLTETDKRALYFFDYRPIALLIGVTRIPQRLHRVHPQYITALLDCAQPAFDTIALSPANPLTEMLRRVLNTLSFTIEYVSLRLNKDKEWVSCFHHTTTSPIIPSLLLSSPGCSPEKTMTSSRSSLYMNNAEVVRNATSRFRPVNPSTAEYEEEWSSRIQGSLANMCGEQGPTPVGSPIDKAFGMDIDQEAPSQPLAGSSKFPGAMDE